MSIVLDRIDDDDWIGEGIAFYPSDRDVEIRVIMCSNNRHDHSR